MTAAFDDDIRRSRFRLRNPYAHLDGDGAFSALAPATESDVHKDRLSLENPHAHVDEDGSYRAWKEIRVPSLSPKPLISRDALLQGKARGSGFSRQEIEAIVRGLHVEMWRRRQELWSDRSVSPIEIADPIVALQGIGYSVSAFEALGQHSESGETFEVAGIINNPESEVQISLAFAPAVRSFTLAHELGHALLHNAAVLHRDRAVDSTVSGKKRDKIESEADRFASSFMMPEKLVRAEFERRFHSTPFELSQASAFALTGKKMNDLQSRIRSTGDLARFLASADQYNGGYFHSLAEQFGVSIEAMANRLRDLGLVKQR